MEMLDIYNENHEKIGVCEKNLTHKLGLWHEVFTCLIINKKHKSIIFQIKNHLHNNIHSKDMIEISVGGHLQAGESVNRGVREIKEETGLDVDFNDLIPLGVRQVSMSVNENYKVREFQNIFLYETSKDISEFKDYDHNEVSDFIEIKVNDLIDLLLKKKEHIKGLLKTEEKDITLDNFVDSYLNGDKLYLRLAIASKRYFDGEDKELIFW